MSGIPIPTVTYREFRDKHPGLCSLCGWAMGSHLPSPYMLDCPNGYRRNCPPLPARRDVPNPPEEWLEEVARKRARWDASR